MDLRVTRMKAPADECESEGEPQIGTHLTDNNSNPPSRVWCIGDLRILARFLEAFSV